MAFETKEFCELPPVFQRSQNVQDDSKKKRIGLKLPSWESFMLEIGSISGALRLAEKRNHLCA